MPETTKGGDNLAIKVNGKLVAGLGKSAYEQAQEGGYTGTEEEFISALANIGSNPTAEGLPVNDVRTGTVRDGQSIAAGDVVNVQGGEVYRDVVAQKNVENVFEARAIDGSDIVKLNDSYSVCAYIYSAGNVLYARLIENSSGKAVGSSVVVSSGSTSYASISLARLDDTHFVVQALTQTTLFAKIGTVNGTSISFGEQTNIISAVTGSAPVVALEADRIMSIFTSSSKLGIGISLVNGTTITQKQTYYLPGNVNAGHISATRIPDDDNGNKRACIFFSDAGDGIKGKAVIVTIDSSNAVTFGEVATIINSTAHHVQCTYSNGVIYALSQTTLYVFNEALSVLGNAGLYGSGTSGADTALIGLPTGVVAVNGSTNYNAVFATWNGTSIEHGSPYKFNIGNPSNYVSGTRISDNEILLAYADTGNSNYGTTTILEISGDQIAGSFLDNSKDAIALESGEGGETIKLGFGGYCACEGITAGQTIDSEGVTAYSPLDGWLEIKDPWAKGYVTGEYTGDGTYGADNPTVIDVGFRPSVIVIILNHLKTQVVPNSFVFANGMTRYRFNSNDNNGSVLTWTDVGVSIYNSVNPSFQYNNVDYKYHYIAWR